MALAMYLRNWGVVPAPEVVIEPEVIEIPIIIPPPPPTVGRALQDIYTISMEGLCSIAPDILTKRTRFEKLTIFAISGWCLWKAYDLGWYRKTGSLLSSVVPGYRWFRAKMAGLPIKMKLTEGYIGLESVREGSVETELSIPACQCAIAVRNDASQELEVVGSAMRIYGSYLVGPDHVLNDSKERFAVGRQGKVSLKGLPVIPLDTDLALIKLNDNMPAAIGVKEAKIGLVPSSGIHVTITAANGKGTTGILQPDPQVFGKVLYTATTMPGYSGSVYASGPHVLGLHQYGGRQNGGFNASYVYARFDYYMKKVENVKMESSEEWILGEYNARKKMRFMAMGLDEVMVEVSGRYSIIGRNTMNKVFGSKWENELGYFYKPTERGYDDEAPETSSLSVGIPESSGSGEARNLSYPGASGTMDEFQGLAKEITQALTEVLRTSSRRKRVRVVRSREEQENPGPSTSGQERLQPSQI